jgi:SAM-dependent methyltransferase
VETKAQVRKYWEQNPCGAIDTDPAEGSREYYDAIERRRNELEPFLPGLAGFTEASGKTLLEIGVGIGTDFIRFVRAGAIATGVDLTERSVKLVQRRLELEGLQAAVLTADAEQLPFPDGSFDRVYSWGVLHHTPDTRQAVKEAIRVLAPGGTLTVMLYHRRSWVAFGVWLRRALRHGEVRRTLTTTLAKNMESAGTKAYTVKEAEALFAGLEALTVKPVATAYDRQVVGPIAKIAARHLGWFLVIRGRKPPVRGA